MQGKLREDKKTYAFFLDIQKAYDSVWHDGLWYKSWDMGVKGRMWRVIKNPVGGMLFADDFAGISDSKERLQKLLDVVCSYCSKW